jgi:hypothetical protein
MKLRLVRTTLLCALASAASCACSSPSEPNQGNAAAGTGGTSAGSSPAAGAATGGSPATGGNPATGGSPATGGNPATGGTAGSGGSGTGGTTASVGHSGQVALFNLIAQKYESLTASFVKSSTPSSKACDVTSAGSCSVSVCPDDLGGGTVTYASAGLVTATSTEVMGSATLTPGADGTYTMPQIDFEHMFSGLEHVNFKATGGEVPAFETELDMPLVLLLSAPLYVKGMPGIDAPRNQDLALSWTRGAENELFYLNASSARADGQPGRTGISCQFPSVPGSGTISASLLQKLAPNTDLMLYTTASKLVQVGDYAVTIVTVNSVTNPDKVAIPNIHLL